MISVAPMGPQNSYEVVRGFSSDFLSTAVEEAIGEVGKRGGEVVAISKQSKSTRRRRVARSFTLTISNILTRLRILVTLGAGKDSFFTLIKFVF